ncbi:MAG: hypothetical protein IKH48_01940 [Prevotella sp.]|nr:hypothetical protein [Prevotella sp.]
MGQTTKEFSFSFEKKDFSYIVQDGNMIHIEPHRKDAILWGDTLDPALPCIGVNVLISPSENYEGITFIDSEELVLSNVIVEPNPIPTPTNISHISEKKRRVEYSQAIYPKVEIEYTGTHLMDGYKYLSFMVSPFRYDAINKKLYLKKELKIKLQLSQQTQSSKNIKNKENVLGKNMRNTVKELIINKDEIEILYKFSNSSKSAVSAPYKYVIVTNDTLRQVFEKLAQWKTLKGVRTKVVTVEECCNSYPYETTQLAIKTVLSNYYSEGMEYALLGGDVDIVPAQICYLPQHPSASDTKDTPADLFYSCLDNAFDWNRNGNRLYGEVSDNVDFDPEFIITRVSVSNQEEAEIFVNRIIEYESSPKLTGWENNMLSCGNILSRFLTKNGVQISDAQYQGEYVYENGVQPYWNGTLFKLFDTYTDHPDGANYEANGEHLQTELEKGYTFVDEFSHAWVNKWGWLENWTLYKLDKASSLVNSGYTTITTISCYSNAFDKISTDSPDETEFYTTCLSESFIRNPNSGILGYFGSSREGWRGFSYYFDEKFYEYLLSGGDKQFGRAAMLAKNAFLSQSQTYTMYRRLIMSLNPIGDPEMPIFTETPQTFDNVEVNFSNGNLNVMTDVSDCKICVSSVGDSGESYYELSTGTNQANFSGVDGDCYLCITKTGYIPYVARVGTSVYLQDETVIKDLPIFSTTTEAGRDVTSNKPQGPVVIEKGKVTISSGTVTLKNDFEVKLGAELEIIAP